MTSRSVIYRKNSLSSAQRFAYISELVDTYCASVQVVQRNLSHIYKILNQKKILSPDLCISLLNAFNDMSKPLSPLCSAFKELANLPDALVSFHLEVFMALSNIQNQGSQVEAQIKRYYKYIISSKLHNILELTPTILQLIKLFRAQLIKVDVLLKKSLGRRDHQSQDIPSVALNKGDGHGKTTVLSVTVVPDPSPNEREVIVHQEESETLLNLKSALKQYRKNLSRIEMRKAKFTDPRNVPLDLMEQEENIRKEMQRLTSEIGIEEQVGKNEAL
jgi:hypothetical protein